jgi:acetylaranotin biosynthesis cluster protein L
VPSGTRFREWGEVAAAGKETNMPYGSYSTPVSAPRDVIWEHFLEKARRPHKYIPYEVLDFKIHEEFPNGMLREIRTAEMHMIERVVFDKEAGTATFTLVDHPLYEGALINRVSPPTPESDSQPVVTYTMDLKPRTPESEKRSEAEWFINAAKPEMVAKAVLKMKALLEGEARKEMKV